MRHAPVLLLLLGASLAACGDEPGAVAEGDRFAGLWRHRSEKGTSELTLERQGDRYLLRSEGTEALATPFGASGLQGDVPSPQGVLRFVFERAGAQLRARYTVHVPGNPEQEMPEVLYDRVAPAPSAPGGSGGGGATPAALVGHWRHTEALSSGGVSLVTDTNLVLAADGTASIWTRSEGVTSTIEPAAPGRWKVDGGRLLLKPDAGNDWMDLGRYSQDGSRLMLVSANGDKQVYERQ